MTTEYSWLPFFEELLGNICRNYNGESLYHIWAEIFPDDYKDIALMDPFTLIGVSMARDDDQKKEYCKKLKEKFNLNANIPDDFGGIPTLKGTNPYFCRECSIRIAKGENQDDVYTNIMKPLWNLANQVNKEEIEEKDYNASINFKPNGPAKLTQVIFICKPKKFYSCDRNNIDYLNLKTGQKFKLEKNFNSFVAFQNKAQNIEQKPYIFSYKAYQNSKKIKTNDKKGENMNLPKNLILYGPPGTGKTYNTVVKAISIIDNKNYTYDYKNECYRNDIDDTKITYQELLERFKTEINKKSDDNTKRIEFVTFHQSYSYEEFVEGIKPYIPEWGAIDNSEVRYIGENGIFKRICKKAESPIIKSNDNNLKLNDNPKIWKVSLMKTGENDIRKDCMKNNWIRIGFDKYGEIINDETIFDDGGSRVLTAFIDKMEIGDIVLSCYSEKTIDAIGVVTSEYKWNNKFPKYKRYREVKWLAKGLNYNILEINNGTKFTLGTVYQLNNMLLKDVLDIVNEQGQVTSYKENDKPYILIIDEINRGDVSKIFGELITLIEEDKRIGNKYQMKVTLPYSKEPFGVPNNLYIIGTMNTADRSIALLDTALRRRFDFEEMPPEPRLIKDEEIEDTEINPRILLTSLNNRIEEYFDKDHKIGHSYLMDVKSKEQLEKAYKNKILPLLNEYFYNDSETVGKVLNCKEYENKDYLEVLKETQKEYKKGADDQE